jgi:hypothetical protein
MTTKLQARRAGSAVPENGEGQVVRHLALKTHKKQHRNFADTGPALQAQAVGHSLDEDADDKAYTNMRAPAAMAKCSLYRLAGGGFLITRIGGGMTREFQSLCAVAGLLRQLGGAI